MLASFISYCASVYSCSRGLISWERSQTSGRFLNEISSWEDQRMQVYERPCVRLIFDISKSLCFRLWTFFFWFRLFHLIVCLMEESGEESDFWNGRNLKLEEDRENVNASKAISLAFRSKLFEMPNHPSSRPLKVHFPRSRELIRKLGYVLLCSALLVSGFHWERATYIYGQVSLGRSCL